MMSESPENDLDDVYARFGRAAEMAQVMELEAGNLALAYALIAFDIENLTNDQKRFLKSLSEDVDRRTFGNLVNLLKKSMDIDQTIEGVIDSALEKRNYLAHRFFRTHNFAIHSAEGRATMANELSELYDAFSFAHTMLHGMTHTLNEIFGNPNISEEQAKKFMEEAKRVEI
ncbi:MAG: hypothetical protein SVR94_15060 [Pseudomonadota bacterium]|nr:hypothetical protein [Pseudomonadota bacterium]